MKTSQRSLWVLPLLMMQMFLPGNAFALSLLPPPDSPLLEAVKKCDIEEVKLILKPMEPSGNVSGKETLRKGPTSFSSDDEINKTNGSGDTPLSLASRCGNLEMVKLIIEHGAEIEKNKEQSDSTALMEASGQGHVEVVKYLISKGADVNARSRGVTPLLEACKHVLIPHGPQGDKNKTVYVLLENGAEVNVQDESWLKTGRTPLMYAVFQGDAAMVQAFLAKGARLDTKNKEGETALSLAKKEGLEYISQLLEKAGSEGNNPSQSAKTTLHPLFNAVKEGDFYKVKILISNGAYVHARSSSGSTPLMLAADGNRLDIVRFLLDKGADVNAKNGTNNTALIYASIKGHADIAAELLKKKADAGVKNINGGDALIYAVLEKRIEVVSTLLDHGAKTDEKYDSGQTALIMAIEKGNSEIAGLLLAKGADANAEDQEKKTALIYACEKGDVGIMKALVAKGAAINAESKYGETALEKAISAKHIEAVRFLVTRGAEINSSGALFSAVGAGNKEIVKILLGKRADVNQQGRDGKTPLMYAGGGDTNMVKYLVEKGADVNRKDTEGNTALMAAVESFHKSNIAALRFLIGKGADINAKNNKGETALILAARRGNAEMARVLIEKGSKVSEKDNEGKSAWTYAVAGANNNIMALLKKAGSEQDYDGMEWEGKVSGQKSEFINVVETKEEWAALWIRAFDKPAPDIDFENYAVACVFLGHSADWLYHIGLSKPLVRDNLLVISYQRIEIMLELSGPFRAGGQYRMMVFKRVKGLTPFLEESGPRVPTKRMYR